MLIKQTIRRQANISKGHTPYCDCNSSIRFARIAANSSSAILIRGELLATKPSIYCRVTWPTCVQLSLPVAGFARANRANRRAPWSSKGRVGGDRDRDRHSVHSPQVHTFYYIQDRYSVHRSTPLGFMQDIYSVHNPQVHKSPYFLLHTI